MPYKSTSVDRIFMLRWSSLGITIRDIDAILKEVARLYQQHGPMIAIGILPADMSAIEADVRRHMNQRMDELLKYCEVVHYAVEGTGFKSSALRSVATSLLLLTGKRGKIAVHKTFDEVVEVLRPRLAQLGIIPTRLTLAAQTSGLLPAGQREHVPGPPA